tara:strand:- start:359 stop:868 length:510 start_codon:yes stop_codon:yes gene_type:complete
MTRLTLLFLLLAVSAAPSYAGSFVVYSCVATSSSNFNLGDKEGDLEPKPLELTMVTMDKDKNVVYLNNNREVPRGPVLHKANDNWKVANEDYILHYVEGKLTYATVDPGIFGVRSATANCINSRDVKAKFSMVDGDLFVDTTYVKTGRSIRINCSQDPDKCGFGGGEKP